MRHAHRGNVVFGKVRWSPVKSLWWTCMACISLVGGWITFSWGAFALFLCATATVLLFGHSLGSHRKLIHDSFGCPKWLEYALVYAGVQVGLAGPLGLLAQHNLRDYAQRQPDCHDFLRHGKSFWQDGWRQLHCDLALDDPPVLPLPESVSQDRFYRFLEWTWMLQQIPPALLLYALGGWPFVIWGVCARITAGVTGHWLIGYFAHNHGGMHQVVDGAAVQGHNVKFASLLTMGESWHNNHHAWPGSAKLGLYPGEWDPGWWVLVLLERAGWVWRLRLPADCPPRPELRSHDGAGPIVTPGARVPALAMVRSTLAASVRLLARRKKAVLQGPCIGLSEQWLQRLAGEPVGVACVPAQARLVLRYDSDKDGVRGLPALLIAIGSRNVWTAGGAILLLPLAMACEMVRGQFQA